MIKGDQLNDELGFVSRYESIIATLCESLDTLDEPEAKVQYQIPHILHSHPFWLECWIMKCVFLFAMVLSVTSC